MHDVELNSDGTRQSGESRALRSVLRNHAEGYALLCFHSPRVDLQFESDKGQNTSTNRQRCSLVLFLLCMRYRRVSYWILINFLQLAVD